MRSISATISWQGSILIQEAASSIPNGIPCTIWHTRAMSAQSPSGEYPRLTCRARSTNSWTESNSLRSAPLDCSGKRIPGTGKTHSSRRFSASRVVTRSFTWEAAESMSLRRPEAGTRCSKLSSTISSRLAFR